MPEHPLRELAKKPRRPSSGGADPDDPRRPGDPPLSKWALSSDHPNSPMRMDRTETSSTDVTRPARSVGKGYAAATAFDAGDYKTANTMQKMDSQPEFLEPETMKELKKKKPLAPWAGTPGETGPGRSED